MNTKNLITILLIIPLIAFTRPVAVHSGDYTAFLNVNVVPMDSSYILQDYTVLVENDRILGIGPAGSIGIPAGALIIDSKGKYLMPGLADMHIHTPSISTYFILDLILFIANGVTTVRHMFGNTMYLEARNQMEAGNLFGPSLYLACPIIDGNPPRWSGSIVPTSPANAREIIKQQKDLGYDFIKVYDNLTMSVYDAIISEAKNQNIPVIGHVPYAIGLEYVIDAGQKCIEHFKGYMEFLNAGGGVAVWENVDSGKLNYIIDKTIQSGIWNCPTLAVYKNLVTDDEYDQTVLDHPNMQYVPKQRIDAQKPNPMDDDTKNWIREIRTNAFHKKLLKALYEKGGKILLGTDCLNRFTVAGFSIHEELQLFVEAGLTPYEAIKAGTCNAAEFLDESDEFGTVTVGKRADLLLLNENPLDDVTNVQDRMGVMVRGNWYSEAQLQDSLRKVATIYNPPCVKVIDSLNFVADYGGQDSSEFTISNIGFDTLKISDIRISGTHFKLADPLTYPILLNYKESFTINVVFTFASQSCVIDTLKIYSNDQYIPNKFIRLIGHTILPAQEGVIYAVTGRLSSGVFLTIDPDSGTGHAVGPSGFSEISGVAIQPATGMIYGTIGGTSTTQLLKIDAKSGRAFEKITLPVPRLRAITFDSNDDLYLANVNTSRLYRLNPVTNDTIYIGTPQIKSLSGLAINPIDGQLWGTGAFDDEIYRIDKKTGVAILVGNTGFINTSDIAFDAAGAMYGLSGLNRLTPATDFIKIDSATGAGTLVGSTEYQAVYSLAIWGKVTTTDIGKLTRAPIPTRFELRQNYPNPFNPSTTIEFALPKSAFVTLKVYNLLGEKVATLVAEQRAAGIHRFNWDAKGLASGVYLCQLEADSFTKIRKFLLLR